MFGCIKNPIDSEFSAQEGLNTPLIGNDMPFRKSLNKDTKILTRSLLVTTKYDEKGSLARQTYCFSSDTLSEIKSKLNESGEFMYKGVKHKEIEGVVFADPTSLWLRTEIPWDKYVKNGEPERIQVQNSYNLI